MSKIGQYVYELMEKGIYPFDLDEYSFETNKPTEVRCLLCNGLHTGSSCQRND